MGARRSKNKPLRNGRNPTTRFARLDHRVLSSPAYRSLSLAARALLTELTMMENGENNGSLYLSVADATDRLGVSDHHVAIKAFAELEGRGFIAMTVAAHFKVKASDKSRARCWRLTWQSFGGRGPSNEWQTAEPGAGTSERKRMERGLRALKRYRKQLDENKMPGVNSTPFNPLRVEDEVTAGVNSTTGETENRASLDKSIGVDSTLHTAVTISSGSDSAHPNGGDDPNGFFVERLKAFWQSADRTSRQNLAESCGLLPADLQAAMRNADVIAASKRAALLCEIRRRA